MRCGEDPYDHTAAQVKYGHSGKWAVSNVTDMKHCLLVLPKVKIAAFLVLNPSMKTSASGTCLQLLIWGHFPGC